MGRPSTSLPIPQLPGYVIDPNTAKVRDANRNYTTVQSERSGDLYLMIAGRKHYLDELVLSAYHGRPLPRTHKDERTGQLFPTWVRHRNRQRSDCGIDNLELTLDPHHYRKFWERLMSNDQPKPLYPKSIG